MEIIRLVLFWRVWSLQCPSGLVAVLNFLTSDVSTGTSHLQHRVWPEFVVHNCICLTTRCVVIRRTLVWLEKQLEEKQRQRKNWHFKSKWLKLLIASLLQSTVITSPSAITTWIHWAFSASYIKHLHSFISDLLPLTFFMLTLEKCKSIPLELFPDHIKQNGRRSKHGNTRFESSTVVQNGFFQFLKYSF